MTASARLANLMRINAQRLEANGTQPGFICRSCRSAVLRRSSLTQTRVNSKRTFSGSLNTRVDKTSDNIAPDTEDTYVPAQQWDGLEWIGSKDWLYARDARRVDHRRFGSSAPLAWNNREEITARLRRAVVEMFALSRAGKSSFDVFGATAAVDNGSDHISSVSLKISGDGREVTLIFPESDTRAKVCESLGIGLDHSGDIASSEVVRSLRDSWKDVSLADPDLKFAIIKRAQQLTGIRLSDSVINSSSTPQAILVALTEKPKPMKVIQALQEDSRLEGVNNVTVYGNRQSRVEQDKSLGRWKIVERELKRYELPVPGEERL